MNRCDFLKIGGLVSAALFMQMHPVGKLVSNPVEVEAQSQLYRGTSDGKILVSPIVGKTWQLHTNFGASFSITGLSADFPGNLRAQLEFVDYPFELALEQNSKTWRTE